MAFDPYSEEAGRGQVVHYLFEHGKKTEFQLEWSVREFTLEELKSRGCCVVLEAQNKVYTITSAVPFKALTTEIERRDRRFSLIRGIVLSVTVRD